MGHVVKAIQTRSCGAAGRAACLLTRYRRRLLKGSDEAYESNGADDEQRVTPKHHKPSIGTKDMGLALLALHGWFFTGQRYEGCQGVAQISDTGWFMAATANICMELPAPISWLPTKAPNGKLRTSNRSVFLAFDIALVLFLILGKNLLFMSLANHNKYSDCNQHKPKKNI